MLLQSFFTILCLTMISKWKLALCFPMDTNEIAVMHPFTKVNTITDPTGNSLQLIPPYSKASRADHIQTETPVDVDYLDIKSVDSLIFPTENKQVELAANSSEGGIPKSRSKRHILLPSLSGLRLRRRLAQPTVIWNPLERYYLHRAPLEAGELVADALTEAAPHISQMAHEMAPAVLEIFQAIPSDDRFRDLGLSLAKIPQAIDDSIVEVSEKESIKKANNGKQLSLLRDKNKDSAEGTSFAILQDIKNEIDSIRPKFKNLLNIDSKLFPDSEETPLKKFYYESALSPKNILDKFYTASHKVVPTINDVMVEVVHLPEHIDQMMQEEESQSLNK